MSFQEKKRKDEDIPDTTKKTYLIHDNGGRPFEVIIEAKMIKKSIESDGNTKYEFAAILKVKIYKLEQSEIDFDSDSKYGMTPILKFYSDIFFLGKSPLIAMTEFSGGHGSEFDGNTILVHLRENPFNIVANYLPLREQDDTYVWSEQDNTYVWIGSEICSFQTNNKIISYVSPVGNNDVPYPYATDENGNIYLIIEDVIIKNNSVTEHQMRDYDNPYYYYYDYYAITPKNKSKYFNDIVDYYIGKEKYILTYHPFPEKEYDRVVPRLGKSMYITDSNNKKTKLTKEMYVNLMESFGSCNFFEPIQNKIILQKRLWSI
jgi:hypothetical protein